MMIRLAFCLIFAFGAAAMAKDVPVPFSPFEAPGSFVPGNEPDELEMLLQRLDAGDPKAWDDYYKYAERGQARRKMLNSTPVPQEDTRNGW